MASDPTNTSASSSAAATAPCFPTPFHLQQTQPPVPFVDAAPPTTLPTVQIPGDPAAPTVYTLPQDQQAKQLFQRDAQKITPEALESEEDEDAIASFVVEHEAICPENDFRLFCGGLGNEVNDDVLSKAFARFPHFNMAKVVRIKRTGKTKGFGFVSFSSPADQDGALKAMNGKYVGNRPIKLEKCRWMERIDKDALEKQKLPGHKKTMLPKKRVLHK